MCMYVGPAFFPPHRAAPGHHPGGLHQVEILRRIRQRGELRMYLMQYIMQCVIYITSSPSIGHVQSEYQNDRRRGNHTYTYMYTFNIHTYIHTYLQVEERKAERKYGDIDMILGRRKNGRTMEYECTFVGQVSTIIDS